MHVLYTYSGSHTSPLRSIKCHNQVFKAILFAIMELSGLQKAQVICSWPFEQRHVMLKADSVLLHDSISTSYGHEQ